MKEVLWGGSVSLIFMVSTICGVALPSNQDRTTGEGMLIGQDLTRVYKFSGNQLLLTSSRQDEHWTIAWEHY